MIAYSYNQNGVFTGLYQCQKNPMEEGKFLIPAQATDISPPEFDSEKEFAVFNGTSWEIRKIEKKPEEETAPESKKLSAKVKKEFAWIALRAQRDQLLRATDFALLSDAPDSIKAKLPEIIEYRKQLRDFTSVITDPTKPYEFPKSPI